MTTINQKSKLKVHALKREMFDGVEHVVAPTVMAVVGVLNGALLTQEALIASAESWNGRPVVVYHPEMLGTPVSVASTPKLFEQRIGFIFNARMDGEALKSDLWIDPTRVEKNGQTELLAKLERGEVEEVSTGYIADAVASVGTHKNVPYSMLHENLRPDHFAILPGQVGACSVADGCGVPRVNNCGCAKCKSQAPRILVVDGEPQNDAMRLLALMALLSRRSTTTRRRV